MSLINIQNRGNSLRLSYFDEQGNVGYRDIPIPPQQLFNWAYCGERDAQRDPHHLSWDQRPVKRVPTQFLDRYRIEQWLHQQPPQVVSCMFELNPPRKFFVDIETEVTDGFPDPETAPNAITAVAFCDEQQHVNVLGTKVLSAEQQERVARSINEHFAKYGHTWQFTYYHFPSEAEMLELLFSRLFPLMPVQTGWNYLGFDWKYLRNRAANLRVDVTKASPTGRLIGRDETPQHRAVIDYLDIYKKYDRKVLKMSHTLDYTGEQVCKIKKVHYAGTLQELYEQDYEKYVFYNAADVILNRYIDYELGTFNTLLAMSAVAGVELHKALGPVWMTEAVCVRRFWDKRQAAFKPQTKSGRTDEPEDKFKGAHVMDAKIGLSEWVTSFDFASLYPTAMRQGNISPETYRGQNVALQPGWVRTPSGAVFDNNQDSVIRMFLTELYEKRKEHKKVWKDLEPELAELKAELTRRGVKVD